MQAAFPGRRLLGLASIELFGHAWDAPTCVEQRRAKVRYRLYLGRALQCIEWVVARERFLALTRLSVTRTGVSAAGDQSVQFLLKLTSNSAL
jgi:hypothetical protein